MAQPTFAIVHHGSMIRDSVLSDPSVASSTLPFFPVHAINGDMVVLLHEGTFSLYLTGKSLCSLRKPQPVFFLF